LNAGAIVARASGDPEIGVGGTVGAPSEDARDEGIGGGPATIGPVGAELGGSTPFGTGDGGIVGGSGACALRGAIPDVPRLAFGICGASGATGDDGVGGRSGIFGLAIRHEVRTQS
jgi:hypothetical protein